MIQGLFFRRISRRLAEVEVQGHVFEVYISNGIDMDFLESGAVCFLREAENGNRRTLFDLYSVYRLQDTIKMNRQIRKRGINDDIITGRWTIVLQALAATA